MLSLALCLFGVHGSFNQSVAQRTIHAVANSDFVSAQGCSVGCLFLQVTRVGSGQDVQTMLMYNYSSFNDSLGTYVTEFGSGIIPNEDFRAPGITITQHVLDTDTTNNPDIEVITFYNDPNTGEFIVLTPNRGRINFEWVKNGQYSNTANGSSVTKINEGTPFAMTTRQIGLSESATGKFKGSLLGTTFDDQGGGSIGTYHQVTLIVERP
jgi:hypothetical protein